MEVPLDLNVTFVAKAGKIVVDAEDLDVFMKSLWADGKLEPDTDGTMMRWVEGAFEKLAAWLASKSPVTPTAAEVELIWRKANARARDDKGELIDNSPLAQKKRSWESPSAMTPSSPASTAAQDPRFAD